MLGLNTDAREPRSGKHGLRAIQVAQVPRKVENESNLQEGGANRGVGAWWPCVWRVTLLYMLYHSSQEGSSEGQPQAPKGQVCRQQMTPKHTLAVSRWGGSRLSEQVDTDTRTQRKWGRQDASGATGLRGGDVPEKLSS